MIYWFYLFIATILEIIWAISVKWTDGYTNPLPTLLNLTIVAIDLFIFSKALQGIPTSIGYTIYVGMGVAGVTICSLVSQEETFSYSKLFLISLILISTIGLQITSSNQI